MNETIHALIAETAGAFEPRFGGFLSNHLPMAVQALWALHHEAGNSALAAARRVDEFATAYRSQLAPIDPRGEYARHFRFYSRAVTTKGIEATLHEHLPGLISGWVGDAYHPLIRLAYGIEFAHADEVAAGLAYLAQCGPDDTFERLASSAQITSKSPLVILSGLAPATHPWAKGQTFTEHAATFANELPALKFEDNLRVISRAALAAFDATHDFFALHLVTGCHAYRICYPYAGPARDAILNLGIFTGYLAIGAPKIAQITADRSTEATAAQLLADASEDEHDLKLAYTAIAQHHHWADRAYLDVAHRYLKRRV